MLYIKYMGYSYILNYIYNFTPMQCNIVIKKKIMNRRNLFRVVKH